MSAVKVRGIYSSALTNLLSKNKFKIGQPSNNVKETFPKLKFEDEYATLVYDFSDKGGIVVKGEDADKVCALFRKEFKNINVNTEDSGHIYLGKIIKLDPSTKNIHVDLGMDKVGLLPLKDYWGYVKEGEKILVQLKNEADDYFELSTKIHLFGNHVVLIQKGFTKVSNNIRDRKIVGMLNEVAEKCCKEDWGALWKTSAAEKDEKELSEEINELYAEYEKIKKKFEKEDKIQILSKGLITCYVRFDKEAKKIMDNYRREVKPTIENHHSLKTDRFADIVDFSENLIREKVSEKKINDSINEFIKTRSAKEGDVFLIAEHQLDGTTRFLKGKITEKTDNKIVIKRFLKSGSVMPLLNLNTERGDYVLTTAEEDREYLKNELFSNNDELRAEYYTMNTPVEIQSRKAITNSVKLAATKVGEETGLVNEDELNNAFKKGLINKELKESAEKTAKKLLKELSKK